MAVINYDSRTIGRVLKSHRESKELLQMVIARELGYRSTVNVTGMEAGRVMIPIGKLKEFCQAYQLEPDFAIVILQMLFPDELKLLLKMGERVGGVKFRSWEEVQEWARAKLNAMVKEYGIRFPVADEPDDSPRPSRSGASGSGGTSRSIKSRVKAEKKTGRKVGSREEPSKYAKNCRNIGQMLKNYRLCRGLTQQQIADKFDFGVNFISMVENGRTPIPVDRVMDLCLAYDMGEEAEGFAMIIYRALYPQVLVSSTHVSRIRAKYGKSDEEIANDAIKRFVKECGITAIEQLQ